MVPWKLIGDMCGPSVPPCPPPTPSLYDIIYEGPLRREELWGEKNEVIYKKKCKIMESKEIQDFLKLENHT